MPDFLRLTGFLATAAMLAALAGCDTFGINLGGSAAPAAPTGRNINYGTDDLTAMVFGIDAPTSLRLLPAGTQLTLDLSTANKGAKHVRASLVPADGDAVDGGLPPPAAGRTYFLLGVTSKDKAAVQAAQKWFRALPDGTGPVVVLDIAPKFCTGDGSDASGLTYSVVPALPGTTLLPIVSASPVVSVATTTNGTLPTCR
jgi:hypothetical protein